MTTRIQLRRDTALRWTSVNPVLAAGEPAFESDTGKVKVGDGITAWASLPYILDVADLTPIIQQIVTNAIPAGMTDEQVRDLIGMTLSGDGDYIVVTPDDAGNVVRLSPGAALTEGLAEKADRVEGVVPDDQLPARLSDPALRAALGAARPSFVDGAPVRDLVRAGLISSTSPIVLSGDSHTDPTTVAHFLTDRLTGVRNQPGEGLTGVPANGIVALGYNGMSLAVWLSDPTLLAALVAAAPSVVIACWLTNDIRTGALGLTTAAIRAAGATRLRQFIDAVKAALPNTIIVLRVPAPYLTVNTAGFDFITDGSAVNPAGLAQIYTDGVRYANYDAAKSRPGVLVYDPQTRLFGTTSPTATGLYFANQIHQNQVGYEAEADDFANWVSAERPWSQALSLDAQASAPEAPWTAYYRDVEDPLRYVLLREYTLVSANPTTFVDLAPVVGPPVPNNLAVGDLLEFMGGRSTYQIPGSGGSFLVSGANERLTGLSLSVTAAAGTKVRAYRRVLGSDNAVNTVLLDTSWRYKKTGLVLGGGTTYVDIAAASFSATQATQPAAEWATELVGGDQVYIEGQGGAPLTIGTNATPNASAGNLRLTGLSGVDWSSYAGKQVVIVGTHA
jgi:hypothetical protein